MLDVAIIGAGPSALTAALYTARAGMTTTVFERGQIGGDLAKITHISNYPGFDGAGQDLAGKLRKQAEAAGAKIQYGECTEIKPAQGGLNLTIDGESVLARSAIVATGSEPRELDFELKVPVSYCALCDSDLAKGENVAVVGGGNSAAQESILLSPLVKSLTLFSHSSLKADHCLLQKLTKLPNCTVKEKVEPTPELLNQFDRVFVFIGRRPATKFLSPELIDDQGYILTDSRHQTKLPGLFASGDARSGSVHQVITAAGDGAVTAVNAVQWLKY